jgi:hypothetical protein
MEIDLLLKVNTAVQKFDISEVIYAQSWKQ